jgi:hypothetical protein
MICPMPFWATGKSNGANDLGAPVCFFMFRRLRFVTIVDPEPKPR